MWWIILIGIIAGLLPLFLRFTIVEEGTAKIIMRWGGVVKVFIQWTGYRLDERGNVVPIGYKMDEKCNLVPTGERIPEKPKRPWYGGLRVWIGTPFDKVYKFKLRWHSVEEVEGKRVPVFHEETKDHVMLRPDPYWRKSVRIETRDGMFPDLEWLITMRCINPEKTIFKSPHNWVENALTVLEPSLRRYIYTKNLVETLNLTREKIWEDMVKNEDLRRTIQDVLKIEWGIQIDEKGIGMFDVGLPSGYQEALARRKQIQLETRARVAAEKEERKAEIIELQHVRDRAIELRDGVKLSPKDAIEVVQTERGKVTKHIIEYKGLEKFRGLPLITIGGEVPIRRKGKRQTEKSEIDKRIEEAKRSYKEGQTFKTSKKG
jgi:regulator of protease activity HflC (stomatin/prohibitin superfamily)